MPASVAPPAVVESPSDTTTAVNEKVDAPPAVEPPAAVGPDARAPGTSPGTAPGTAPETAPKVTAPDETAPKEPAPDETAPDGTPPPPLVKVATAIVRAEEQTGKKLVPFLCPVPTCKPAAPAVLTPEQQDKYDALLALVCEIKTLPVATGGDAGEGLGEAERAWLTRECLLRYLRAAKWDVAAAKKRLESTLAWRRDYGVASHTADYISVENETGKQVILGYDNECRPCLYLNPARQNTARSPRQIQALVFMLECIVDLMPAGQETLALLVDFKSSTNASNPNLGQGREVLSILQNHYPERLGRALCINIPWFVWGFFKLINPFIDPLTREKLKFNENLREHVPPEQLDKKFGGDCDFDYQHATFWPELNRLCRERREQYMARWRAAGSPIGASEVLLKGGGGGGGGGDDDLTAGMDGLELKN